jgi:hypothetical protein
MTLIKSSETLNLNGVKNVGLKEKDDLQIVVSIDPSVSDYQTLQTGVVEGVQAIASHPIISKKRFLRSASLSPT